MPFTAGIIQAYPFTLELPNDDSITGTIVEKIRNHSH